MKNDTFDLVKNDTFDLVKFDPIDPLSNLTRQMSNFEFCRLAQVLQVLQKYGALFYKITVCTNESIFIEKTTFIL